MLLEVGVRGWRGKDGVETGSLGADGGWGWWGRNKSEVHITGNEMGNLLIEEKGLINM